MSIKAQFEETQKRDWDRLVKKELPSLVEYMDEPLKNEVEFRLSMVEQGAAFVDLKDKGCLSYYPCIDEEAHADDLVGLYLSAI